MEKAMQRWRLPWITKVPETKVEGILLDSMLRKSSMNKLLLSFIFQFAYDKSLNEFKGSSQANVKTYINQLGHPIWLLQNGLLIKPSLNNSMLFVKSLTGTNYDLNCNLDDTIETMKDLLEQLAEFAPDQVRLLFAEIN